METASICRTCLSSETFKNISDLQTQHEDTCSDIIFFCLNIKVEEDSQISTKLCLKCFKKIMSFYKFKLLALKNDAYLKTAVTEGHIKNEVYVRDDNIKSENESSWEDEADNNVFHVKLEPSSKEQENESDCQSDNEFLSVIKKIKYEFVPEDSIDEIKENTPVKQKRGKRGRPPGTTKKKKTVAIAQVCEECGKTVKNLREHAIQHMPASARKRYSCKSCDKTFATCTSRNKHIKTKHLGIKKTCPVCNKLVVDVWTHTRLMHDSASLTHACAPCGRRFISQSALDAHTSLHTRDRPHACDCCGKQFRAKLSMQLHRRQVHDKEKSHLCQFCSKSFFKKYHLQVHLRTHTKEKPYKCSECNKSFATSTILNNHRTVHSDVKRHACTLCNMAFARPGYLRVHMISHTKEKKHSCKYCGIKFGRSDHRKRHEYTAHERHLITNLNTKDIASITDSDAKRVTNNPKETATVDESSQDAPVASYTYGSTEERVDCGVYEKSRSG